MSHWLVGNVKGQIRRVHGSLAHRTQPDTRWSMSCQNMFRCLVTHSSRPGRIRSIERSHVARPDKTWCHWPGRTCPRSSSSRPSLLYHIVDGSLAYGEVPSNSWSTIWQLMFPRPDEYATMPGYLCSHIPLRHLAGPEVSGSKAY